MSYGIRDCEHDWVKRTDGYEEQCMPAVCVKCGAFGCYCDALRDVFGREERDKKIRDMETRGVAGDADTSGQWVNPYVKLKNGDLRKMLVEASKT